MINKAIQQVIKDNKTFIVETNTFSNSSSISNDINVLSTFSQIDAFILAISARQFATNFTDQFVGLNNLELKEFYNSLYLNTYKDIDKKFFNSYQDSVFTKTKTELGTDFDGVSLLGNLNFLGIVNIEELKEQIFNNFSNDPCLVIDTEPDPEIHPLRVEMIKGNYYLACRTHILDFQLRNILVTSIFDNTELYKLDNSYVNYCFDTFIQRLDADYYQSVSTTLHKDLIRNVENGTTLTNPITNNQLEFLNEKEQDSKNYLRFLFDGQFIVIMEEFNKFMSQQITSAGTSITLSNLITVYDYYLSNIKEVDNIRDADSFTILYTIDRLSYGGGSSVKAELILRAPEVADYISFIETSTIELPDLYLSHLDLPQEVKQQIKAQFINNPTFSLLFKYCFSLNKILDFVSMGQILLCSSKSENVNINFETAMKTLYTTHKVMAGEPCPPEDASLSLGFNVEILKLIALAPIEILKGLEETFDPNIFLSSRIKKAAEAFGAPDISVIPYSAQFMLPPPYGLALPPLSPWGYVYWGISAGETALNWAQNGYTGARLPDFSGSYSLKNPLKAKC
jgi:hypothetical protein